MGFEITFWKFNKEGNSTKRPSLDGTTFNCVILRGSSLINPTIEMNLGLTNAPDYNYCYIPNFNRYYYINEWTFNERLWTADLSVDVLATYRNEIGNEDLYALRTSNSNLYDGRIIDTLYPTKSGCTFNSDSQSAIWTSTGGMFCLGIVNDFQDDNYRFGSVCYELLTSTQMGILLHYLMSDELFNISNGFDIDGATWEIQKSITDPLQYIKSCVYIPIAESTIQSEIPDLVTPRVANWNVYQQTQIGLATLLRRSKPTIQFTRTFTIPKHPQTNARGNFVNTAPYTNLCLYIQPFGMIEIDSSVTCNASEIVAEIEIDVATGLGILEIKCNGVILNSLSSQIGVPVQMSQITRDYIGGVTSIIGGITGTVSGILSGNVGGAISSATSGIGNAINSLAPRSQSIGNGGSYAQLMTELPTLYAQFFECVDDDIEKNGRPCCKVVNCSAGGYFKIQDGDVPLSASKTEWEMVKNELESGFYWE